MLEFNGQQITDIADVGILDIKVGNAPPVLNTRSIPARDGQYFVQKTYGPRQISVSFTLMEPSIEKRLWFVDRLNEWLSPRKSCELRIGVVPFKHLLAVCTKNLSISMRDWWEDLSIVFTAYDPAFVSDVEKSAPMNTRFIVSGSESPAWRIEQQGGAALQTPRWVCNGKHIELSGDIVPSGLTIDAVKRTIGNHLGPLMTRLTLDSGFFDLYPGMNEVITSGGAGGRIFWRERML